MVQLDRILSARDFVTGHQLGEFLRYVVEQRLGGQSKSINQYSIAVDALGYGADFDPNTNPTVRVIAGRLRRALDHYYLTRGVHDPVRIELPKGSYVPVFREDAASSKARFSSAGRSQDAVQTADAETEPCVAVVVFDNLNPSDEADFLAKGLTEEILVSLTRFSELEVLGPLLQAEGPTIDYSKIHRRYGAQFVLQGSVQSQGSLVRIMTELTNAETGRKQWARTFKYDLEKTSLFELEDEVTSQVTGEIADGLGIIFQKMYSDTYSEHLKVSDKTMAVLKYNHVWMTLDPSDWVAAIEAIHAALEQEPDSALLVALQSNSYYGDVIYELNLVPDAFSKMEGLAQKAVSLDPNLQIARYNLVVQNCFFGRTQQAVEEARRVVAMNPNHARIVAGCGSELTTAGAYEMGKELMERAKRLNPHYPSWYHFVDYLIHFRHERYAEAWSEALKIHVEGVLWHPLLRAAVLGKLGRTTEARDYLNELLRMRPDFPERPRDIIRLIFVLDEHIDMIWDGLRRAGLDDIQ